MLKFNNCLSVITCCLLMTILFINASHAQAAGAGENLYNTLRDAIGGNIGFFIGLAVCILGLWTWIIKQETGAGILMIIGGVLITLAPSIFTGTRGFVGGVVEQFASTSGQNYVPPACDSPPC